jgi:flagellar biosynthesis protein FlhF
MKIKKYRASSLREALLLVKQDMGPNAVVLKTRRLPRGLLGVLSSPEFEVTAAQEAALPPPAPRTAPAPLAAPAAIPALSALKGYNRQGQTAPLAAPAAIPARPAAAPSGLQDEIRALQGKMEIVMRKLDRRTEPEPRPGRDPAETEIEQCLREQELDRETIIALQAALETEFPALESIDQDQRRERAAVLLAEAMPVSGPLNLRPGCNTVALVGSTGAGKTTTLAKLAAHYSLVEGKKVGLIAADNYRLAATDQLKAFASIAQLPVEIVYNAPELVLALRRFSGCDLVLIDTAGRSPQNRSHLAELKALLAAVPAAEIHLVLSLTTRYRDLENILRQYKPLGVSRLLFTKLDETRVWGSGYRLARDSRIPVSYLGTGQAIPEDLQICTPEFLPQTMLGGILV